MLRPSRRNAILRRARVPTLLTTNLVNLRYLTGLQLSAGSLLLTRRAATLFVDGRYLETAKRDCARGIGVRPVEEVRDALRALKRCGIEADDVTVARLRRLRRASRRTHFLPTEGVIEALRRVKRPEELRCIRRACRITDHVLARVPRMLRAGVRERDIAAQIETLARQWGADGMAFETIVAFGRHSSLPHHRAGGAKLQKGDLVQIDMGVKVRGYCSDCSRVFFTKRPTEEQHIVFRLLSKIVKECTKRAKAGASNRAVDRLARVMLRRSEGPSRSIRAKPGETLDRLFLHSLGHGVGLEIHEGVNLSSKATQMKLRLGEVITIEPGIYVEEEWGMRLEDTVIVGRKRGTPLTRVRM